MDVLQIQKIQQEKEKKKIEVYEKILSMAHKKIEFSVNKGETQTIFLVPDFIFGYSKPNFGNLLYYIIEKLKQKGFKIQYYYPNTLLIQWDDGSFNAFIKYLEPKMITNSPHSFYNSISQPISQTNNDDFSIQLIKKGENNGNGNGKGRGNGKAKNINIGKPISQFKPKTSIFNNIHKIN